MFKPGSLVQEILALEKRVGETGYTDTGETWELLKRARTALSHFDNLLYITERVVQDWDHSKNLERGTDLLKQARATLHRLKKES